ncbi:MAG: heparinase II/III family protein [Burkholderiaceae bacterium]|nr:heparinase II/III family protein [Burkholderiaceae bacterium]
MTGPSTFTFIGQARDIAADGRIHWGDPDWARLWRYNLHYFDDLAADGAAGRRLWHEQLVNRWIADNPLGKGTGWEPYPTSLRIVNWIKWALADDSSNEGGVRLSPAALDSLAVQARWLRQRLEIHLLGNHLWANAKALVFAGAFFDGPEAKGWLEKGLALMDREVREQILRDGGHFERSPMYHAILLEDLLDLIQLDDRYPGVLPSGLVAAWRETAVRMLAWLRVMTHPDGGIAFFNDAALGIAPDLAALDAYLQGLRKHGERPWSTDDSGQDGVDEDLIVLADSGYARLRCGPAVLLADIGPVGPDYLPGHAHADTLSFELSLHGHRVIVNSGISTYEAGAERLRQRGTATHNTVVIDGTDSSEVWSSFRVARRARPFDVRWGREADGTLWLQAAHDGYRRLPGRMVHRREWRLDPAGLRVIDRLEGRMHTAEARFHLHPSVDPADLGADIASLRVEASTWHPRFGRTELSRALVADFRGRDRVETPLCWSR